LGKLSLSLHTGAHADAPLHVRDSGADVAAVDLDAYWGMARVVDWIARGPIDRPDLEASDWKRVERVLFRTRLAGEGPAFGEDDPYLTADGAAFLCQIGLKLVGIDRPSLDAFASSDLPAHRAFVRAGVATLEGLVLSHVEPGDYELVALPLALEGAEASPVRAALRTR
jgi:arylformamidase